MMSNINWKSNWILMGFMGYQWDMNEIFMGCTQPWDIGNHLDMISNLI